MEERKQILYKGSTGLWELVEGPLPAGVQLDTATGELYGEPTEYGEFPCVFKLTNRCGTTTKEVLVVACSSPVILSDEIVFDVDIEDDEEDDDENP